MDVPTLARLEHENLIATLSAVASQMPGSVVRRGDGLAILLTGHPLRLFNQLLVDGEAADPAAIGSAVALARDRGDQFVVSLRRGIDDGHVPVIDELGLVPAQPGPWMPGMALHPLPAATSPNPDERHEIRRVRDRAGVDDHILTAAAGFEMPVDWLRAVMSEHLARRPDVAVYVGYVDGEPVTTGMGVRTGTTVGVYNIATVPAARRRGYGDAMTMRIVADGAAEGCETAILQASDMGFPIYERQGFRTVVEYMAHVDPAPPSGPSGDDGTA